MLKRIGPIMALAGLFLVIVQINRQGGSVMALHFREAMGVSATEIGLVMGAMYLGSTVAQIPTGILFDRFGARLTLSAMGAIAVGGIFVLAVSSSVLGLATGRFLIGIGHGGVITGIYMLAIAWTTPDRMASTSSLVIGIAGGIGGILATTPLALALVRFGFEWTFLAVGVATGAITISIWLFVLDRPVETPGAPRGAPRTPETLRQSLAGVWEILRNRDLHRVIIMGSCFSAPFSTIGGLWAGPYLAEVHGLDPRGASTVLLTMVILFHAGTLAYGPLDRLFNTRKQVVLAGVAAMIVLLLALALWVDDSATLSIVLLAVFAFVTPIYPTLMAHARGFVPVDRVGRAITVVTLIGLGGVFLMQIGTGALMDAMRTHGGFSAAAGYRAVFLVIAATLAIAGWFYAGARDIRPRAA